MRPFLASLGELLGEDRLEHYAAQFAELCQEVAQQRKGGELTLSVKLTPNSENSMKTTSTLKVKLPSPTFGERIVFTTANGDIVRDDPRQEKLNLKSISPASGE